MTLDHCFFHDTTSVISSCSLQGFCDASKEAYAAVIYLVMEINHERSVRFVTSKTRVSPLKTQTIPRLELLAALLLARLMNSVTSCLEPELNLTEPLCYTDSEIALYWIRGDTKVWKQFVQRRVMEIREHLPSSCWRHCPGVENPADLPSRGLAPFELANSKLWIHGPKWLTGKDTVSCPETAPMPTECAEELRVAERQQSLGLLVTDDASLFNCERYSSIEVLIRVVVNVLRFVSNLRNSIRSHNTAQDKTAVPAGDYLVRAEMILIKSAQDKFIGEKDHEKYKKQFDLFKDKEGIWRCGGRLAKADIPALAKHPIFLPHDHHLTTLLVRRAHKRVLHNGVKDTLTEVRSRYWVVKGRSLVKRIVRECVICKRYEGRPCLGPPSPPLPDFRVTKEPPFTHTGVDFAGPLHIKTATADTDDKVWICLYTCSVTRAVHLDIVPKLSAPAFIRSLKRFTARRGLPRKFVSDNGKTFKAANKAINVLMQSEEVKRFLSEIMVEWQFNLAKALWWGGMFERLVQMVKRCLRKMIGRARLTYDELSTVIIEVEGVINSRPLCYVTSDDLDQPITPAHLLSGRRLLSLPDAIYFKDVEDEVTTKQLTRRLLYLNKIIDSFWKRWQNEYLVELRDAHRYGRKTTDVTPVKIGEVVLIHDESRPRGFWKLARVENLITGTDNKTRGVVLRTTTDGGRTTCLQRPLQLVYPLEVTGKTEVRETDASQSGEVTNGDSPSPTLEQRPRRAAAIQARDRAKALVIQEEDSD